MSLAMNWKGGRLIRAGVLMGLMALAGCASVPRDAGFAEVRSQVAQRLGQRVQWNRGSHADRAVAEAVRGLLKHPLTADAAVQIALINNPSLQADYEKLGIAQADLVQAGLLENPVFTVGVLSSGAGTEQDFGVVQNFLNVLTRSARRHVAKAQFQRTQHEVGQRIIDLAARVKTAYYRAVADQQQLELYRQVITATEAAAELAERQYQAGTTNRLNQELQQTLYAQSVLEAARFQARMDRDRERLNRLLGLWGGETRWTLAPRLPEVPRVAPALAQLESLAVAQRLDLAASRREVESLAYALGYTRRYRFLSVLGIGVDWKREPGGDIRKGPTLELGLPLFDQGQARVARLEAQLRRGEQRMRALAIDIRSQVREARARLLADQARVHYYRDVLLPLRQRILTQTQRYYNGMLLGVYDLLLAKQNEIDTARGYIGAIRDYWLARTALERAVGGRLAWPAPPAGKASTPTPPAAPATPAHTHGGQ